MRVIISEARENVVRLVNIAIMGLWKESGQGINVLS